MQAEPLLFENIYEPCFIFPNGVRVHANKIQDINLEYKTSFSYHANPVSITQYINYANLENFKKPYIIFNDCFECPQMQLIKYSKKTINKLNNEGLYVFLVENLIKYDGLRVRLNRNNLRENLHKLENNIGLQKGEFNNLQIFQLDSLNDLVSANNLVNVTVYVSEYGVKDFSNNYNFNIFYKDIDLLRHYYKIKDSPSSIKTEIKKVFLNYNFRYEPFRHVIAAYLSNYNSKISWYFRSNESLFKNSLWFEPSNDLIFNGFKILNSNLPLELDLNIKNVIDLEGSIYDRFKLPSNNSQPYILDFNIFNDVFCSVISESGYFDPTSYISDKTLFTIWNRTPFIIVGPPGSLSLLKKLGFKTFNNYWDESYDQEFDHKKRILKIFRLIDILSQKSQNELNYMIKDMNEILLYNKKNFQKMAKKMREYDFAI